MAGFATCNWNDRSMWGVKRVRGSVEYFLISISTLWGSVKHSAFSCFWEQVVADPVWAKDRQIWITSLDQSIKITTPLPQQVNELDLHVAAGDLSLLVKRLLWFWSKDLLCLFTININSSYMMGKLSSTRVMRWRTTPSGFHFLIDGKTSSSVEISNMKDVGTAESLCLVSLPPGLGK